MTKRFSPEYTAGDVLGLYRTRSQDGDEGRLRGLASDFRQLCRLEHEVTIPKQYEAITKQVRTPFVRDAAHRIASSLVAKEPLPHTEPLDEAKEEYRQAANIAERWDKAFIERVNKERQQDIVFNLAYQHVRDGESVLKVVHRPDAWANFPERDEGEDADTYLKRARNFQRSGVDMPLVWRDIDRLSVVYENGEYGDDWIIEYGEYAKPYLRSRYAMRQDGDKLVNPRSALAGKPMPEGLQSSSTGNSVKVEFFTAREWHVIVDGSEAPGFPKANPYSPYLPYFRAPAYDMESMLYSLLFLVPRMDELLTMKLNWSVLGAYPNPILETIPNTQTLPALAGAFGNPGEPAGGQAKPIEWSPGKFLELPLGKRLTFLTPPPVGKDLNDLIGLLKDMIDIAGIPSIMRGISGGGDSGYHAAQMRAAVDMAYKISAMSLQRQLEKALEFSHWLVAHVVRQTVYVQGWSEINPKTGRPKHKASKAWVGLSPDSQGQNIANIANLGAVSVQFRPTTPTDQQANAMIAMQLTNAAKPLYDRRTALERWMQEEDPDAILAAIRVDELIENDPTLKQMTDDAALAKAGLRRAPPPAPAVNPAAALVGPNGQPLLPPGPNQLVPQANQAPPGVQGIPGLTMPISPTPPGVPVGGNGGNEAAGVFPGRPGGPNNA
ncbi:MAG: hypothetical protein WC718_16410 [Phycisphaerales bacterium]|jgi:hypothetical protein